MKIFAKVLIFVAMIAGCRLAVAVMPVTCAYPTLRTVTVDAKGTAPLNICSPGNRGIAFSFEISSSLAAARGLIELKFFDSVGRSVGNWVSPPFVGQFRGLQYRPVVPVPASGVRVEVIVRSESGSGAGSGSFTVAASSIAPGMLVDFSLTPKTVFPVGEASSLRIKVADANLPGFAGRVNVFDVDGRLVRSGNANVLAGGEVLLSLAGLTPGFYRATLDATVPGYFPLSATRSFGVVAGRLLTRESRFGVDAALSWYGGSQLDLQRAIEMMQLAGVGSVRDRLSWSSVQPSPGVTKWGRYQEVARHVSGGKFEQVTVFHDSPLWARPTDSVAGGDRRPPTDMEAIRKFGVAFARDMGGVIGGIEFWNEVNTAFYAASPWLYANSLKAFTSGVKSVSPSTKVLVGAAAGRPGEFFDIVYSNGASAYFDVLNQHYYGRPEDFDSFLTNYVHPLLISAGLTDHPSWLTEAGYSLRRDDAGRLTNAEREQAAHLVKTYAVGFAGGYEKVFYFFLRELLEDNYHNWGILDQDFSPRPAYVALATLTRHVAGMPVVAVRRDANSTAVFFRAKSGTVSAVVWGKGALSSAIGLGGRVTDIFGRTKVGADFLLSDEPLLVSGLVRIPADAKAVVLKQLLSTGLPSFRMPVVASTDDEAANSGPGHQTSVAVSEGGRVTLKGAVIANDERLEAGVPVSVSCSGSKGIDLLEVRPKLLHLSRSGQALFECDFRASLAMEGRGFVRAEAATKGGVERAQVNLIANVGAVASARRLPVLGDGSCPRWVPRSSKNLKLSLELIPGEDLSACSRVRVMADIQTSGESWVFPAVDIAGGTLTGAGLTADVEAETSYPFPPRPLMAQIVDTRGAIWTLDMEKNALSGNRFRYSGLFSLARIAPWSPVKPDRLDLNKIREVMFGWGGYGGQAGQKFAYLIDSMSVFGVN